MSVSLTINGVTYSYPETGDVAWGAEATDWASAVTVGMLQKAGGLFQLLSEVDFGTTYGIKSAWFKSRATNPADAGVIRLGNAESINWANAAHDANKGLTLDASNIFQLTSALTVTGNVLATNLSGTNTGDVTLGAFGSSPSTTGASLSGQVLTLQPADSSHPGGLSTTTQTIPGAKTFAAAMTLSSTLTTALTTAGPVITSAGGLITSEASLAVTRGGTGTGTYTTGDILYSDTTNSLAKLAANTTATRKYLTMTSSVPAWNTELDADIPLTSAHILVGNVSNVAVDVAVSGDLTLLNTGAFTVAKIQTTVVSGTTGSTNVMFSASPTTTGTLTAAAVNMSGDLAIATNKFTVASGSGNTIVAGTIGITGTTTAAIANFSGKVSANDTTDSSSVSTGGLITAGGLGVAKAVSIGTTLGIGVAPTARNIQVNASSPLLWLLDTSSNLAIAELAASSTEVRLASTTGNAYLPLNFYTNGTKQLAINTAGLAAFTAAVTVGTTLGVTQLLTPTGGIKGVSTNTNATTGNVGEYIESVISTATNVPGNSGDWSDMTSITLGAGDWDISLVYENVPNSSTQTLSDIGMSTTTGNSATGLVKGSNYIIIALSNVSDRGAAIPSWRQSLSGSTIVYAKLKATYTIGTPQYQCRLSARRVQPGA